MQWFVAMMLIPLASEAAVSFRHEVLPILTRQGCNAGTCHGSPSGKGGFALSLFAFDAEADHTVLTKDYRGRRIDPVDPDASLLLRKPSTTIAHRGGLKLPKDSREYRILRQWISEGCLLDEPSTASCNGILLKHDGPSTLRWPKPSTKIKVTARFADGTTRDVTHLAQFTSSDEAITTVRPDGTVTGVRRGVAAVMVRYLEYVEARAFTFVKPIAGFKWTNPPTANYIDNHVHAKLRELQFQPTGLSPDNGFVRRVHLDVLGRLPTPAEQRAFVDDAKPDKRTRLIDSLLKRPEHALFWAQKWGDLLRLDPTQVSTTGTHKFHQWLVSAQANNLPYDQFTRALLTANGSTFTEPPANYYRTAKDPHDALETTAQLFMGSRLACAKCHNHPFERWTQDNYYGLAAVFQRVERKTGPRKDELFISGQGTGEVTQPRTGQIMKPFLPGKGYVTVAKSTDRRAVFANWLTTPGNPWFARVEVNRIWSAVMGRGIVEPIDDFRDSNPPSNAPLLQALAADFEKHRFDRRHLLRTILNSRTYQASAQPATVADSDGARFFAHYTAHRLNAEQLLDAISDVTGVPEAFAGLPAGTRATALPGPYLKHPLLKTFGMPPRTTACACERPTTPQLAHALELINGNFIHNKIIHPKGRLQQWIAGEMNDEAIINELFALALCRKPTAKESEAVQQFLKERPADTKRDRHFADLFWAVLNMNEFLFQH